MIFLCLKKMFAFEFRSTTRSSALAPKWASPVGVAVGAAGWYEIVMKCKK
jgi:hypothetical protein